jgi:hypothetical protein
MLTWEPTIASTGSVVPSALKISCPMNFPAPLSHILGGNLFDEYITSYSSILVVVTKTSHQYFIGDIYINNLCCFLYFIRKIFLQLTICRQFYRVDLQNFIISLSLLITYVKKVRNTRFLRQLLWKGTFDQKTCRIRGNTLNLSLKHCIKVQKIAT